MPDRSFLPPVTALELAHALRALGRVCNTKLGTAIDELRSGPMTDLDVAAIRILVQLQRDLDAEPTDD